MTSSQKPGPNSTDQDTRERILAAAATVLARDGFAESKLTAIAEIAGVQPPAIYYYFESRMALLAEVLRSGQQRVRQHVHDALAALPLDASHAERIEAACHAHLSIQFELADFARAVTRNMTHATGPDHERLRRESRAYHDLWRDLLEAAARDGALRPDLDLSAVRMFAIGALNSTTEWFTPDGDLDQLIIQARRMIRRALFSDPET